MKKIYKPHESTFFKKANIVALISYLPAFIFLLTPASVPALVGYIILAFGFLVCALEKKSEFVRIHALFSGLFYEINMLFLYGMDNVFYYTGYASTEMGAMLFLLMHEIIMICVYLIPCYCIYMAVCYRTVKLPFYTNLITKMLKLEETSQTKRTAKKGRKTK